MARQKKHLGAVLLEEGAITADQLSAGLAVQKRWGGRLGSTLVRLGLVSEDRVLRGLSTQLRTPSTNLSTRRCPEGVIGLMSEALMERYEAYPLGLEGGRLVLAMIDPTDLSAIQDLEFRLGVSIRAVVSTSHSIRLAISRRLHGEAGDHDSVPPPRERPLVSLMPGHTARTAHPSGLR
jgi:type IV pilus assembly protein PilB